MMDYDFLEKLIIKSSLLNKDFLVLSSRVLKEDYFDDPNIGKLFKYISDYINEYNDIPSKDVVINSFGKEKEGIKEIFDEVASIDFDVISGYDFL
jgi:hypothetical protein